MSAVKKAIQAVLDMLTVLFAHLIEWVWAAIGAAVNWVVEQIELGLQGLVEFVDWALANTVGGSVAYISDGISAVPWAALFEFLDHVNWFIPIYQWMAIVGIAYSFGGIFRLFRYIVGWVPTVEG